MEKQARVGFGVMILNSKNQVLLGKRNEDPKKASSALRGEGTWTCPGGKLDFGESLVDGAKREVKEETGLDVKKLEFFSLTDERAPEVQFITAGFLCKKYSGKVKTMEPEEITEWQWFDMDNLPKPMYPPSKHMINNFCDKIIFKEPTTYN